MGGGSGTRALCSATVAKSFARVSRCMRNSSDDSRGAQRAWLLLRGCSKRKVCMEHSQRRAHAIQKRSWGVCLGRCERTPDTHAGSRTWCMRDHARACAGGRSWDAPGDGLRAWVNHRTARCVSQRLLWEPSAIQATQFLLLRVPARVLQTKPCSPMHSHLAPVSNQAAAHPQG